MGLRAHIWLLEIGKLISCEIGNHLALSPKFRVCKNEIIYNWRKRKKEKVKNIKKCNNFKQN